MAHPSARTAIAASVTLVLLALVVLQLLPLLWPRAVAAKISKSAKVGRQWHPQIT